MYLNPALSITVKHEWDKEAWTNKRTKAVPAVALLLPFPNSQTNTHIIISPIAFMGQLGEQGHLYILATFDTTHFNVRAITPPPP